MKLLLHPLAMPIYTFALFMEIERQSYVIKYETAIIAFLMLLTLMILTDQILKKNSQEGSPLVNIQSPLGPRIAIAASITTTLIATTFIIKKMGLYTWGSQYILLIYIIPAILNITSGAATAQISERLSQTFTAKNNAAPGAFAGALSGFTIMIGYKTGTDTFWAFVITLIIHTLSTITYENKNEQTYKHQTIWYIAGATQAAAIMYIGK